VTPSGIKDVLQIPWCRTVTTHSWLNQEKSVTSTLQKLFEKKFSWTATVNN
jgi:hypothetical protein